MNLYVLLSRISALKEYIKSWIEDKLLDSVRKDFPCMAPEFPVQDIPKVCRSMNGKEIILIAAMLINEKRQVDPIMFSLWKERLIVNIDIFSEYLNGHIYETLNDLFVSLAVTATRVESERLACFSTILIHGIAKQKISGSLIEETIGEKLLPCLKVLFSELRDADFKTTNGLFSRYVYFNPCLYQPHFMICLELI